MENNLLVQEILKGIIHKVAKDGDNGEQSAHRKEENKKASILILLSDPHSFTEDKIKQLKTLKRYGYELSIMLTQGFEKEINKEQMRKVFYVKSTYAENEEKPWNYFEKTDLLLVPFLSQNTGAKLRMGIHDEIESSLVWEFLWQGKVVAADSNNFRLRQGRTTNNPVLKGMVEETLEHLQRMGIHFLNDMNYGTILQNLCNHSKKGEGQLLLTNESEQKNERKHGKNVVTERDIIHLVGKTNEMVIPKDCIVTPLARDKARDKGITLIRR